MLPQDRRNERAILERRLQLLREQQAIKGISADPSVQLEIEAIELKIKELETESISPEVVESVQNDKIEPYPDKNDNQYPAPSHTIRNSLIFFCVLLVAVAGVIGYLYFMPTQPNGILIEDFEDGIEGWYAARANTNGWGAHEVAIGVYPNSNAAIGQGALQGDFEFNRSKENDPRATFFLAELPVHDWTKYNVLQFKVKSLVDPDHYNIRVFIALATGTNSCWNELGDFQRLEAEYKTYIFNLDRALYKTCQNLGDYKQVLIGKDQVVKLNLIFMADHQPSGAVLVDDIWLVKP